MRYVRTVPVDAWRNEPGAERPAWVKALVVEGKLYFAASGFATLSNVDGGVEYPELDLWKLSTVGFPVGSWLVCDGDDYLLCTDDYFRRNYAEAP